MAARPVDFILVGLGNPGPEYTTTRHNGTISLSLVLWRQGMANYCIHGLMWKDAIIPLLAGFLFIDYLATVMALDQGWETPPSFQRRMALPADVRDVVYTYKKGNVSNSLRIVMAKPLTFMNDSGTAVRKLMDLYQVTDPKKLIAVSDDINTLPGALAIQDGGDLRSLAGQKGQESIATVLGTTSFIRLRLGVGRPPSGSTMTIPQWVLGPFGRENKEMDLFAWLMGHTTEALLEYVQTNDLKHCRKKFAKSRKVPTGLAPTESLEYPVRIEGM